jgi:hypothetical protein
MIFDFSAASETKETQETHHHQTDMSQKTYSTSAQKRKFMELESLPSIDEEIEPSISGNEIIEEHEGVPHISEEALSPDPETDAALNRDLKNLVDSVVGQKT